MNSNPSSHTIKKTAIMKYRPYLSLPEIGALINLCSDAICAEIQPGREVLIEIKSALKSLMKTKMSVDLEIAPAAYAATPRTSLEQKLGFDIPIKNAPDFSSMMDSLSAAQQSVSQLSQKDGDTK